MKMIQLALTLSLAVSLYPYDQLKACGHYLHIHIGQEIGKKVDDKTLATLLKQHQDEYFSGVNFPDVGYADFGSLSYWGEFSHWSTFLNEYTRSTYQDCQETLEAEGCKKRYAHLLGALIHSITDINFDRYFLSEVAKRYYSGSLSKAQKFTDFYMDFIASKTLALYKFRQNTYDPYHDVIDIYRRHGFDVSRQQFKHALSIQSLAIGSIKFIAPIMEIFYRQESQWAHQNYLTAKGGVFDTAQKGALFINKFNQLYRNAKSLDELPKYRHKGGWPQITFWIEE